jgi:hypothetical protein
MKDLFFTGETIKEANAIKVSPQPADWGKEALNRFFSDFPELSNLNVRITFKEKDKDRGYGVGSINLGGQYALPVIIRDFQMFPFDVALTPDNVIPFTKETIKMVLANKGAFSELSREEDPEIFLRYFDSPQGLGAGAMEKGSEWKILDEMAVQYACDAQFKEKVAETLVADPYLTAKVEHNPALYRGLAKIAAFDVFEDHLSEESLVKQASADIHYVFANDNGTFTKMSAQSNIDEVFADTDLEQYEINDVPRVIACETVKIASFDATLPLTQGYTYRIGMDDDIFISKEGNYRVLVGKDFAMTKKAGYDEGNLDFLASFAAMPESGDSGVIFDPATGDIKTSVITMDKVAFFDDGLHRLTGTMLKENNRLVKFATLRGIERSTHCKDKNTTYLPEQWVFAKLGTVIPENKLGSIWNEKLAEVEAVRCIGLDHYEFLGETLSKYAERHNLEDGTANQVAFGILHCGGDVEDVEKVANLKPGATYVAQNQLSLPFSPAELVEEAEKIASAYTHTGEYLFDIPSVIKLAADLGSENGVDAVLGTAFLRKDTLDRFIEAIPMFEEASSTLAKLLLYIRMGSAGIGEAPVREAMKHLGKVIYQLTGAKNMNKLKS